MRGSAPLAAKSCARRIRSAVALRVREREVVEVEAALRVVDAALDRAVGDRRRRQRIAPTARPGGRACRRARRRAGSAAPTATPASASDCACTWSRRLPTSANQRCCSAASATATVAASAATSIARISAAPRARSRRRASSQREPALDRARRRRASASRRTRARQRRRRRAAASVGATAVARQVLELERRDAVDERVDDRPRRSSAWSSCGQ